MNNIVNQYKDLRSESEIKEHREKRKLAVKESAEVDINAIINNTKKPLKKKIEVLEQQLKKERSIVNECKIKINKLNQRILDRNKNQYK